MIVACSLLSEVLFELFALHSHAMTHQEQPVFCEEKDEGERQRAAGDSDDNDDDDDDHGNHAPMHARMLHICMCHLSIHTCISGSLFHNAAMAAMFHP